MREGSGATAVVLLSGVLASGLFLLAGLALHLVDPAAMPQLDSGQLEALASGLAARDAVAFLHVGVVILMFTPIARVLILLTHYVRVREWTFALISLGVLFLLGIGVLSGLGGD